jgi:hypothetical protein
MASFGSQLGARTVGVGTTNTIDSQGGDPGNSGNGHGKKKGHSKTTTEPQ